MSYDCKHWYGCPWGYTGGPTPKKCTLPFLPNYPCKHLRLLPDLVTSRSAVPPNPNHVGVDESKIRMMDELLDLVEHSKEIEIFLQSDIDVMSGKMQYDQELEKAFIYGKIIALKRALDIVG